MIFGYLLGLSLKEGHVEGETQGIRFEFRKSICVYIAFLSHLRTYR